MSPLLFQFIIPFFMSSCVVIAITVIAERYGTKVGGIVGTLPSNIVIAFLFIALNRDVEFASNAVTVVPAEMGINIIFLFTFVLLVKRYSYPTLMASLLVWITSSSILFFLHINNIFLSIAIYATLMISTFLFLEKFRKIKSSDRAIIVYTPLRILFRGLFAGTMIAIAVILANISETLSGIFSYSLRFSYQQ